MAHSRTLLAVAAAAVAALLVCSSAASPFDYGPSPAEYGILQLGSLRNSSHNLVLGWRQYGDRLLLRQTVHKGSRFFGVVTAEFSYPPPHSYPRPANITAVYAIDLKKDGHGAFVNLTSGGVGMPRVSLRFKSQRGYGVKHLVEVYGK
ncbi:probable salivary secreted peptide [Schistocerca cancellata]|uniref:probable salivary secreted peptide n=1 Tax=Schistocerca cancellata TaxID=274614 RepID=UPI002117DDD5|nr:probable salivary secreted peptide [Schistocerca cancellata]